MSPTLNGSSVQQCFEHGNAFKIHNGTMFVSVDMMVLQRCFLQACFLGYEVAMRALNWLLPTWWHHCCRSDWLLQDVVLKFQGSSVNLKQVFIHLQQELYSLDRLFSLHNWKPLCRIEKNSLMKKWVTLWRYKALKWPWFPVGFVASGPSHDLKLLTLTFNSASVMP